LKLKQARVKWFLSINYDVIPDAIKATGARTYRSLKIGEEEFEFSGGFTDLHTRSYEDVLDTGGYGLEDTYEAIKLVHEIREAKPIGLNGNQHDLANLPLSKHPFS